MPNIVIIMGNSGTGKSRTIRALTGVYNHRVCSVETQKEIKEVYVSISSLQESDISPKKFINQVQNGNYQNVLVSLWIRAKRSRKGLFPTGREYIQNFIDAGWSITKIAVLGINNVNLPRNAPNPQYISNSRNSPSNTIASQIRKWWQWL